jgi:DNA-binding response OmpR family regulator
MVTREVAHVLLTGDDISFLIVMEKLLRGQSYVCDCAHDVQTAAAALEARSYDLLIADLDLPGNRELELVRAGQGDGYSMPVIVLTGSPSVLTAVQSLYLAVVVEYLIKPVDPVELLRCVGPAVTTGRFWRAAFQTYHEMTARYDNGESLKRRVAANELTRPKSQLAWGLAPLVQQRGLYTDGLVEHCQGVLDAGRQGVAGPVVDVCTLRNCPRLAAYEKSLRETIAILKKTKTASAAKDLAAIRTKLEMLLQDSRGA